MTISIMEDALNAIQGAIPKRLKLNHFAALALAATLAAPSAAAWSQGILRIKNLSNTQQDFIVTAAYRYCLDFPGPGAEFTVPAGGTADVPYAHRSGHNCDDKQGQFAISPVIAGVNQPQVQIFQMNDDSVLYAAGTVPNYPSWVDTDFRDPATNFRVYTWNVELPGVAPAVIGRTKGYWTRSACGGGQNCTLEIASSISTGSISKEDWTKELTQEISYSITAGLEVETPGVKGSMESTFTASTSGMIGNAQSLIESQDKSSTEKCTTPTDMLNFQIYQVWQWATSTKVGNDDVIVKTCQITCTRDDRPPNFLPGQEPSLTACKIPVGEEWPVYDPVEIPRSTPAPIRKNPKATCIRLYSGENGGGRMEEFCADPEKRNSFFRMSDELFRAGVRSYTCGKRVGSFANPLDSGAVPSYQCRFGDQSVIKIPPGKIEAKAIAVTPWPLDYRPDIQ